MSTPIYNVIAGASDFAITHPGEFTLSVRGAPAL